MNDFNFNSFGNNKQNILLCDIDECYICNKLKQTLAEIKEICKSVCGNGLDEEVDKFGDIIDKINEVEDEKI